MICQRALAPSVQIQSVTSVSTTQGDRQRVRFLGDGRQVDMIVHQAISENAGVRLGGVVSEAVKVGVNGAAAKKTRRWPTPRINVINIEATTRVSTTVMKRFHNSFVG